MRLVLIHDSRRISVDVNEGETVKDLKKIVIDEFAMAPFLVSENHHGLDLTKLKLTHAGAELQDKWILYDVGIANASILRVVLIDIKPTLVIDSKFNGQQIYITDKLDVFNCGVSQLRTIVTNKTGLPIGVFRFVSKDGEEMYDCHSLRKYNVTPGQTIKLEVWDGWADILKSCTMGYVSTVLGSLSQSETEAKYQMKVALHMAAFHGHVDMAVTLLKMGVRPDEPVGFHPMRMWCSEATVESLTTPIHTAVIRGNLNVIRSIVYHDITSVMARDGLNCTPLQTALRLKRKTCASFLISQQWKEIPFDQKTNIPLSIYAKMKSWCERARHKAPSSCHPVRARRIMKPVLSLVGNGVLIDGFSESKMKSKTIPQQKQGRTASSPTGSDFTDIKYKTRDLDDMEPEQYFKLITSIPSLKLPGVRAQYRKSVKSAHFLDHEPDFEKTLDVNDSPRTESPLKLPSIIENNSQIVSKIDRQLSRSFEDLCNQNSNTKLDVGKFHRRGRQSMPQLKLFYTAEDHSFRHTLKCCRSHSMFPDGTGRNSLPVSTASPSGLCEEKAFENMSDRNRKSKSKSSLAKTSDKEYARTIFKHYQEHMGVSSRQYASNCLSLADSFKDKPWLLRMKQARTIATTGIRRTFDGQSHLFAN